MKGVNGEAAVRGGHGGVEYTDAPQNDGSAMMRRRILREMIEDMRYFTPYARA